jgi:hypothetical protein
MTKCGISHRCGRGRSFAVQSLTGPAQRTVEPSPRHHHQKEEISEGGNLGQSVYADVMYPIEIDAVWFIYFDF